VERCFTVSLDSARMNATLWANMSKFLLPLTALLAVASFSGCSLFHKKKPESSSHLYEGNAPSIHFNDKPEAAGGEFNPS